MEKKVEEGVKVQVQNISPATSASGTAQPSPSVKTLVQESKEEEKPAQKPAQKVRPALSAMEGDNPFAGEAKPRPQPAEAVVEDSQPTLWDNAPPPAHAGSLSEEQKGKVFGSLLKSFRTTRRNAVLFTLCMDLESSFEGDTLILSTETDAVFKALNREENARFIREALADLGVFAFEVRLKPKGESKWESAERRLRENFKGIDIDIK